MMRALWTEETPEFDGKYHKFDPIGFNPKSVQKPCPPLIFGGESRAALKRTAELADGWCGIRYTPESVKPHLATLRALCRESGRDYSRLEITAGIEPGLPLTLDAVKQFEDAGVHRLFVFPPGWMRRSRFESDLYALMERFANEVMGKN